MTYEQFKISYAEKITAWDLHEEQIMQAYEDYTNDHEQFTELYEWISFQQPKPKDNGTRHDATS